MKTLEYKKHKLSNKDIELMSRAYVARALRLTPAGVLSCIFFMLCMFLITPQDMIVSIIIGIIAFYILARISYKKIPKDMWNILAPDNIVEIAINDAGIAIRTAESEGFYSWRVFEDVFFVKECVVIKLKYSAALLFKESYFDAGSIAKIKENIRPLERYFSK